MKNLLVGIILNCFLSLGIFIQAQNTKFENLEGKWVGIIERNGDVGDAEIEIKFDGVYTAEFIGPPSLSGFLFNIHVQAGEQPNTTTMTMVTDTNKEYVLRFYLMKKANEPQLFGTAKLDLPTGSDVDFNIILEAQPCCDPKCLHVGKSKCY
ncbi:MAG: hypothetical protein JXR82_01035 [Marinifilaceae bacterium]|nr:hypothetical protein [Marinifilaceae bacterium]